MKDYAQSALRNICLAGHGSAGKTSLTEALLFASKAIDRPGNIAAGNTCSDFDAEEIKRGISISASVCPVEWKDCKINIIDTPGFFDFAGEAQQGIQAADTTLVVVSAKDGVEVGTEHIFGYAGGKPRAFFVTKLDEEHVNYSHTLEDLANVFGVSVCPITLPLIDGDKVVGYVDLLQNKAVDLKGNDIPIPADVPKMDMYQHKLIEGIAETDEGLMEKYFNDEPFTPDEIRKGVVAGIAAGTLLPVFAGTCNDQGGVSLLLDDIVKFFPSPGYRNVIEGQNIRGESIEIEIGENEPFSAFVFKTVADPFVGKMSYFRVTSGTLTTDKTIINTVSGQTEKIGRIYVIRGKKQIEVQKLCSGDIGVVTKLANTNTGDTLCESSRPCILPGTHRELPPPCLSMAVLPKTKGDEDKIAGGLQRLCEEDTTISYRLDRETKQQILSGLGEMHLDVIVSKLKNKFGVAVELKTPRVPYRETIKKKVKVEGKHKKQSGGHGQYGHVWIEFEPGVESDLVFEEKIFGGSVPKNFFPAVEKGLRDSVKHGVLAGYPVVNLKATLLDGSYHPVDSNELAFKVAAGLAFKAGLPQANPVLLEPIGMLKVVVPEVLTGSVISDLNRRRGTMLGMNPMGGGTQEIMGEVPMSEMHTYATDLRSLTRGRGSFEFKFERYQEAPAPVAQKVIAEAQAEAE